MGKASTNAGIHPYLKSDFISPIKPVENKGIPLTTETPIFLKTVVNTEYKDSNNKDLYFKDEVELDGSKYVINYDPKNFRWILVRDKKTAVLKEVYKRVVLKKKCKARSS